MESFLIQVWSGFHSGGVAGEGEQDDTATGVDRSHRYLLKNNFMTFSIFSGHRKSLCMIRLYRNNLKILQYNKTDKINKKACYNPYDLVLFLNLVRKVWSSSCSAPGLSIWSFTTHLWRGGKGEG